jgi:hypothetical protein
MKSIPCLLIVGLATISQLTQPRDALATMTVSIGDCLDSARTHVLPGQHALTFVRIETDNPVGSVRVRVQYEFPGLTFLGATAAGQLGEWEYFTWSHVTDTLFPDSGYATVDLIAVADLDNGEEFHPDPQSLTLNGPAVALHFLSTKDRSMMYQCPDIALSGFECGQFVLRSLTGDTAYVPAGSDVSCPALLGLTVVDGIVISDGAVCISSPPDDRGDINLNGIEFDVGDAVLLCRFLVFGDEVWDPVWEDVQVLSTDVNDDGVVASVGDLVFLVRLVASGGIPPYDPGGCW